MDITHFKKTTQDQLQIAEVLQLLNTVPGRELTAERLVY